MDLAFLLVVLVSCVGKDALEDSCRMRESTSCEASESGAGVTLNNATPPHHPTSKFHTFFTSVTGAMTSATQARCPSWAW